MHLVCGETGCATCGENGCLGEEYKKKGAEREKQQTHKKTGMGMREKTPERENKTLVWS